jgi:hypothetical protein
MSNTPAPGIERVLSTHDFSATTEKLESLIEAKGEPGVRNRCASGASAQCYASTRKEKRVAPKVGKTGVALDCWRVC